MSMQVIYDDGGREDAGFVGEAGDCVTRAIAIATGVPYKLVYAAINERAKTERPRTGSQRSSARNGVHRSTYHQYMLDLGWHWTPTMGIGTGCTVHLREGELPGGRIIVRISKHVCAVIDGVIHDTHDPQRDGNRCCYGYYHE
jgi:hypothetical protein